MSQNVTVTRHIGPANIGMSQAQVFADADGIQYFVKYKENGQDLRILINEFVAAEIAKENNLLCPESFIVTIDPLLIPTLPSVNGQPISAGPHFATKRVSNLYSSPALRSLISKCNNIEQYPAIILFDAWLYNIDRRNPGNFLILTNKTGLSFCIIDHGHCFGMNWTVSLLLQYVTEWSDAFLPEMYAEVKGRSNFDVALEEISLRNDNFISNLVDAIPVEWAINAEESIALKKYLTIKRDNIENLLTNNQNKFPNWA